MVWNWEVSSIVTY